MNWKLKCLVLQAMCHLPQRAHSAVHHLTGRYFLTVSEQVLAAYAYHSENFHGGRALEFGAGSHLLSALLLSAAGADEVLTYDLARLATQAQVNHVIRQLRGRVPGDWPEITNLEDDLARLYRIRYLAPADAQHTGLPSESVDFFCSTSTLEHVPPEEITSIFAECKRLASPRARMSHIIDYHDHYASSDRSITRFNFYRYSDAAWRFFNPSNHYQNRLRHSDYERLFAAQGLAAIDVRAVVPQDLLERSFLHERFRHYSDRDLTALNGFFHYTIRPMQI